jgi:hypothetical protein
MVMKIMVRILCVYDKNCMDMGIGIDGIRVVVIIKEDEI